MTEPPAASATWIRRLHERAMRRRASLPPEVAELYGVTFYTCLIGLFSYFAYIPLFVALGAHTIAVANVVVIGIFAGAAGLVLGGRVFAGMATASSAVAGHAWLTALTLGVDAGFQLHVLLALELGLLFAYVPLRRRLLYAAVFLCAYLGLVYALEHTAPSVHISAVARHRFELLNSAIFASVTVLIATYYAWSVSQSRAARERVLLTLEARNEKLEVAHRDLARARDDAEEASRAKSRFLANMSHELRTPLNAIIGYSEMIEEEALDAENAELADEVGRIHKAGRHLLALINDILDLSKIEAGHMECEAIEFTLSDMAQDALNTLASAAASQGNELISEVDPDIGTMDSDPTKVRQILFNLLSNACKFTEGGSVTLVMAGQEREGVPGVRVAVRDTGIGIPENKLEHIFSEFSQADASTTRRFGGTGLGLTITHRFAEMLGGTIAVRSVEGEGSTFEVWLPRVLPPEATP